MPIVAKKAGKPVGAASAEDSRRKAFDDTPAAGDITPGKYDAVISEAVLQESNEKGQSVRIKSVIINEGDHYGEPITMFYKIFEADGETGQGIKFLKRDMLVLGQGEITLETLPQNCASLTEEHPGIVLTVAKKGNFTNAFLGGLCENEELVQAFLEKNPF